MNNTDDTDERLVPGFVPEFVRQRVLHLGQRGERWLAELPDVIAHLERAWSITVGQALAGGTGSFVARARTAEGGDAILKIAIPEVGFADELRVLESAQGHGYVRLLADDREREAMLLEALGPPMASLALPPEQQIALLCQMLRQAWQAPRPAGLVVDAGRREGRATRPHGQPHVGGLGPSVFGAGRATRPCGTPSGARPRSTWSAASWSTAIPIRGTRCRCSRRGWGRRRDSSSWTRSDSSPTPPTTWEWCCATGASNSSRREHAEAAAALARRYCALLSAQTGVEETAIWEWGFLERVSSGLYCLELGIEELGRPFLQTAEMLSTEQI